MKFVCPCKQRHIKPASACALSIWSSIQQNNRKVGCTTSLLPDGLKYILVQWLIQNFMMLAANDGCELNKVCLRRLNCCHCFVKPSAYYIALPVLIIALMVKYCRIDLCRRLTIDVLMQIHLMPSALLFSISCCFALPACRNVWALSFTSWGFCSTLYNVLNNRLFWHLIIAPACN